VANNTKSMTRVIAGVAVPFTYEVVPIEELKLDPENPRIRFQIVYGSHKKPRNPDELLEIVKAQSGYDDLQKQIRKQGSIHEPLIVRHDGTIVEGNTRFAVAFVLNGTKGAGDRWKRISIHRLPKDVPEKVVQLLMADYHISGKNTWRPVAQADQLHRLVTENGVTLQEVADATRMTVKKVEQTLAAFNFLITEVVPALKGDKVKDKQAILESKFSHARELMQRKDLKDIREDPALRAIAADAIAHDKIKGVEMRKLSNILNDTRAKYTFAAKGFKAAAEVLQKSDPAADSRILASMKKLTAMVNGSGSQDIELFKTNRKAQDILEALVNALNAVRSFVVEEEKHRAR